MSIYRLVTDCLPAVATLGLVAQLVDHQPTSSSGLGNLNALILIRPLRVDFGSYGERDRHIGAIDIYSPSMSTAWSVGLTIANHLRADCETKVYDLRPDTDKHGLMIASVKVASWYEMDLIGDDDRLGL